MNEIITKRSQPFLVYVKEEEAKNLELKLDYILKEKPAFNLINFLNYSTESVVTITLPYNDVFLNRRQRVGFFLVISALRD